MLNKMGMGNLGGLGGKVNTAAMGSQLNKRMKMAQMKERMRAKASAKAETTATPVAPEPTISEEEILKIFSAGEKAERTPRGAKPTPTTGDKKKKKGKK